uniref:NADH-ubiquinone oxidoreductase chain 5 n=1 Tax=Gorpis annulatus TaxID=696245 RepID=K7NBP7_9HEMI|nr:NADH dehydrogenase subunit 5 [Gorpis annulatus]AEI53349.1 NADH dehydrogenase subunit 5 [Gorpis annulatus]
MKMSFYVLLGMMLFIIGFVNLIFGMVFMFNSYIMLMDWEIFNVNSVNVVMTILFDWMSFLFMSCVYFISSMVVFYSYTYMKYDKYNIRFLYLIMMFIISMMFMIASPNLISILLGWDGLGLVSYGLVVYFQNYKSYNAGMLTVLTNRIGDVSILLGIGLMMNYGSWNYIYYIDIWDKPMYLLMILIILASFTKSAQIPFSSWLPAAMAAPTPVSALVHSSTLVTAGVYLLIRFSNVFMGYDCSFMVMLGMMTMFMAGLGANFEFDLKSIIALSTLSQLGMMVSSVFLGLPLLAFFHMLTHAFFSALLFLCAGLIIHLMSDSQDIRHMGGIMKYVPYTSACFCVSNFSLCGLPFMSGFYSKDMILESISFIHYNLYVVMIFYMSVGLTVMYTVRMLYYSFYGNMNMYSCQNYYEDFNMIMPMFLLTILSIVSGSMLCWFIFPFPLLLMMPLIMKMMTFSFIFMGLILGYMLNYVGYTGVLYPWVLYSTSMFLGNMWFMPQMSKYMIYNISFNVSMNYYTVIDMGWGEYLVSGMFYKYIVFMNKYLLYYYNNNIKYYMLSFIIMMMFFLF